MKKRILSILLALCMLFCLVPTTAFAADCAEDLVDPVIWIHLSSDGGGYYDVLNGTWTAADFFQPGKAPKGAKITAVTPPTSPSIPVSVNVNSDGTLNCTKTENTTEPVPKSETYTVTITSDDYAPISAPLTVRQYLNAGFRGPVYFDDELLYGDTYTYTCRVNNPGENGVWSALIQDPQMFEIYKETTDTTSEPGKSIYTVHIRAIKAGARITCIDFLYVSDTTMASSKVSRGAVTGGAVRTRPLTVTAGSATITEGNALPTDLVTCTGLLNSEGRKDDRDTVLDNALGYQLLDANNEEVTAATARNMPGTYTVVPAATLKSSWGERYSLNKVNGTLTVENQPDEQFTLAPGGRYYFDLSAMNIPGTVNSGNSDGAVSLPDTSLHYVPFTYVGTIEAYKLTSATVTTEEYAQQNKYPHSLFVADYAVTHTISWGGLNDEGLIFGKNYASGGVDYTLRAPSVGSISTGSGDSQRGVPQSNEWDTMLNKNSGYIQNWNKMYSWGQDTSSAAESFRAYRGYNSARFWYYTSSSFRNVYLGFRPVLELPTGLAADNLKVVELRTVKFMPGEQQNWINIIVKNGESFTAPSAEGLPRPDGISADAQLWWVDENSNFYKPGDTVPADVSALTALWGGFGLFLDRGDGEVEVTPDNYTDIFGDGTASFVLPKGKDLTELGELGNLTGKDILEIYSTGRLEKYGSVFPNLKLKNADLTSVRLSEEYVGDQSPLFVTLDGKNTVGSLNGISMSRDTLSILGDGSLTLNGALTLGRYTQYGGGSVTMTDGLTAYDLTIDSGSLTVTGDPQAITLRNQDIGYLEMGDGARLFTGSSAQDATEAAVPQLSAEMQEVYQRYLAEDSTLTNEEISALSNALRERFNAIFRQLPGKTYVRITGAWDVTYQPGTNGSGNAVTDIKFYNDALTLRGALFTRTGHTQVGWATVDGGEKVYGLDDIYTKNEALTLYPVWSTNQYTITFDTAGGSEIAPITQDYGTNIAAPADPTREGYTFIGWDRDIPEIMPAENMTVTAQWEINRYTITFDTAGGSEIAPITQGYGTAITAPADPTREGYTFIGWDMEIPTTMPAENMTLKARWRDTEKPTGEIIIGTDKWHEFLNTLTFGLFFKDTQTVTINASDNSGTVFISYLVTDRDLSEAELQALVFSGYEEPFRIDPNGEYIVYAMLVDESLNITYLRSDRITLDNVQPVISGIENGKTYCEAQTVTVDEKYVDTVTVNGTEVELDESGSFVLSPADGEQKIVVTDKAGNTAEMTVTVNDGHTYGEWVSNGDGTHTRQCTVDGCNGLETKDCSGGKATCKDKAVCDVCGKAYGELDPKNHTDLKHNSAKAATENAEGNTEYWYCEGCDKYYSDKYGTKEIKKADTVTAKLPKSPPTGDTSNLMLWIALLFISGGIVTGTTVISKKKKHSAE